MRILKANGHILDIDDDTAIGIDYQAYDFKKAGDIKVNVSNTFNIPATVKNLKIFGFAGRSYSYENATFTRILVDYYIRNEQYITKGVARIEKIEKGRIHLFVAERPEFIDEMKTTPLNTFLSSWFFNAFDNYDFSTFNAFVDAYANGRNGIVMPLMNGNLSLFQDVLGKTPEKIGYWDGTQTKSTIAMAVQDDAAGLMGLGGHFSVFLKPLFDYIETYFNVDLNSLSPKDYNIFADSLLNELFIPVRNISYSTPNGNHSLSFGITNHYYRFIPHDDLVPYDGLTVYDFFTTALKLLGYALEPLDDGTYEVVRLDLINLIKSADYLPGFMAKGYQEETFIPNIQGYGINNYIKMKPYSDGGEFLGAKESVSANKNLDEKKDLFKVDAYIPPFLSFLSNYVPDMAADDSFKNITFFKKTTNTATCRVVGRYQVAAQSSFSFPVDTTFSGELVAPAEDYETTLMIPEVYTVASEYNFLDNILATPETRIVKRWVNSSMMKGFRKLAPYYVREFGAWYFVNKISNFNPEKSKEPVKFELIRLPWVRMPGLPEQEIESTDEWILADGTWADPNIWIDTEQWNDTDPN